MGWDVGECEPPDKYDDTSPRQTFDHWTASLSVDVRQRFTSVDFFTDLDLNASLNPLLKGQNQARYTLVVSAGHHEYWSRPMRDNVKAYLAAGGNVATFSGNTCFRDIQFQFVGDDIRIYKVGDYSAQEQYDVLGVAWTGVFGRLQSTHEGVVQV